MPAVVEAGINSFKFFFAYKGAMAVGDDTFLGGLLRCKELGALPMVRAAYLGACSVSCGGAWLSETCCAACVRSQSCGCFKLSSPQPAVHLKACNKSSRGRLGSRTCSSHSVVDAQGTSRLSCVLGSGARRECGRHCPGPEADL